MKKNDLYPAILWVIVASGVITVAHRLGIGSLHAPGPGLMPFLLGVLLLILSVPILLRALLLRARAARAEEEGSWAGIHWKNVLFIVASLVGYALLLEQIGFVAVAFLFLLILFKGFTPQRWLFSLSASLLTVLITYILFAVILKVELPGGILGRMG